MIDLTTKKTICVQTDQIAGPYIWLPFLQVEEVRQLLRSHGIRHWLDDNIFSLNGGPETAIIKLGREGNAQAVQAILDGAPNPKNFHDVV